MEDKEAIEFIRCHLELLDSLAFDSQKCAALKWFNNKFPKEPEPGEVLLTSLTVKDK